jgi:hypothetical protein
VTTLQPFQLGNLHMAKGSGNTPLAVDVSLPSTDFTNGAHYRLPWAVSRDLQPAAITGKELYFRVTDSLLKDVAHGGGVQTGFDFDFSMFDGTAVPYVIKSYDGAAGTLMGVFKPFALAGSAAATRGYLYFGNPGWIVSKEEPDLTFPNATSVLFLPSGVDRSGSQLDFDADLPTSDKVIVNPGALVDGSQVAGNDIERALTGNCGSFLISFLCQSIPSGVDNAPLTFGSGTGTTVIYLRHCNATPNGPHPDTDITNCWRVGFATGGKEADYETAQGTADQTLQHIVFRRVLGSRPELYINGVLSPFAFSFEDIGTPAILSSRLDFTNQKLIVGRGSNANSRWWNGYIDCFKFFKDDAKSATWALAEYANLMDIDGAVIFGSPETVSTSSVFGETIKVQADQLTSVDFKADKYSATVGGTIALRASAPFDNSTIGRLTDRGANTVRYTNTVAQDPDNGCAVHLTNGVGNVIIPVRAKINLIAPPPPSGYYKIPNIQGKTAIPVTDLGTASTANTLLWALARFNNGTYTTDANYIKITGQIDSGAAKGKDIIINAGGSETHPLVIMCDAPAGSDNWSSRSGTKIKDCCLIPQRPWTWFYGLWSEMLPSGGGGTAQATWNTNGDSACYAPQADNCFITACRMSASQGIHHQVSDAVIDGLTVNFNWYEIAAQQDNNDNNTNAGVSDFGYRTQEVNGKTITHLTHMYNRYSDHSGSLTNASINFRAVIVGNGNNSGLREPMTGSEIGYNFIDARCSHPFEFKNDPIYVHHNHYRGNGRHPPAGLNTRGGNGSGTLASRTRYENNRLWVTASQQNCGYADYVNCWLCDDNDSITGEWNLFPPGTKKGGGKGIDGCDGTRWIGCKGHMQIPRNDFETATYNYGSLGASAPVLIAGHVAGNFTGAGGEVVAFTSYPPGPGTMSGAHDNVIENQITRQNSVAGLGYTVEKPPVLNATITGPAAIGKTWGQ